MKIKILQFLFLISVIFYSAVSVSAQTPDKNMISTNGPVMSTVQNGDTLFIGGRFTQIGIGAKRLALLKRGNTKPDINFPQLNNATVTALTADGSGGFYIAGNFTDFNGIAIEPTAILHVLSDGSRDDNFGIVELTSGNSINALAVKRDRLYVGGDFYSLQRVPRPNLLALSRITGSILNWIPATPNYSVDKIIVNDSFVFVKGTFNQIGNQKCNNGLAALKISNGKFISNLTSTNNQVTAITLDNNVLYMGGTFDHLGLNASGAGVANMNAELNPSFPAVEGLVWAAQPDGKSGYYIGGNFTSVGGINRYNIAHISANGKVDAGFYVNVNGAIFTMTIDKQILYIGGTFSNINGVTRNSIASIDLSDNSVTSFDPSPNGQVYTITLHNDTVYMGGSFNTVKGFSRNYVASITTNNKITNWAPNTNNYVNNICLNETGTTAYLGGFFTEVNNLDIHYLAKVNTINGNALSNWNPAPDNAIYSVVLYKNTLYVKGIFNTIGDSSRLSLGAVDTVTGKSNAFKADLNGYGYYHGYNELCVKDDKLYVAGSFYSIQNIYRSNIARINLISGRVDNFNEENSISPDGQFVTVSAGNKTILFGGQFQFLNGAARNHFAAVNVSNSNFTIKDWNPIVQSLNVVTVNEILHHNHTVFAGGEIYYSDRNIAKRHIIGFNDSTGSLSSHFTQYPNDYITDLAIFDNKLMVSGNFYSIDSNENGGIQFPRKNLAAYNLSDSKLSPDIYDPNATVKMILDNKGNLITAGNFTLYNYIYRQYLAAVDLKSGLPTNWNPYADGAVYALERKDSIIYVAGVFNTIGSDKRLQHFLAALNMFTGKTVPNWIVSPDEPVYTLALKDTVLYAGGGFTKFGSNRRNYAAAVSTGTGAVTSWNPNMNYLVEAILPVNNDVYVGGRFTKVNGSNRQYLTKVDNISGVMSAWKPNPDQPVYALAVHGNKLFVGGSFTKINGTARIALAAFDTTIGALTNFDAHINKSISKINSIAAFGHTLYFMGLGTDQFGTTQITVGDSIRGGLVAVDTAFGYPTTFDPKPMYNIYGDYNLSLWVIGDKLFSGGDWVSMETNPSATYFGAFTMVPQQQASNLKFNNIKSNAATISCTIGSGEKRLIVIAQSNQPAYPLDGISYNANPVFGKGDSISQQCYVIYADTGSAVRVTRLSPGTSYFVSVFEYNGSGNNTSYLEYPLLIGSFTTKFNSAVSEKNLMSSKIESENTRASVYPNPATNRCIININAKVNEDVIINMINEKGNLLLNYSLSLQKGINSFTQNITQLQPGAYFIRITHNNGEKEEIKFIKQ